MPTGKQSCPHHKARDLRTQTQADNTAPNEAEEFRYGFPIVAYTDEINSMELF